MPEIAFQINDAWPIVRGVADGGGAPLLLMDKYSRGILYVLAIPENPSDLYALPQGALTQIKRYIMTGFPVWMDAPAKVSLFAYDNKTFVVESFLDATALVTLSIPGSANPGPPTHIRNLITGELIEDKAAAPKSSFPRGPQRIEFNVEVPPHSFVAFGEE